MANVKLIERLYKIRPEDLLQRELAHWAQDDLASRMHRQVVMVTGAAGSIGSELCRQIAALGPQALVGFDQAETPLFLLERELAASSPKTLFHPELGNLNRPGDLGRILQTHQPSIVFHAAAYKHVAMMERNPCAAVENNVVGTWLAAHAAVRYGVTHFVSISTDKAVHPTSVMGATKRLAEQTLRWLGEAGATRFVSVRFGNVLGSSGSVLPLFQEQIAAGGPVTITHRAMERYFMTAPEAVQLVLQAFGLGAGGEIFVLDMGQPIKILDLATRLITLCGLKVDRDIRIEFTGAGQGEKLSERLNLQSESLAPTAHSRIFQLASQEEPGQGRFQSLLKPLQEAAEAHDEAKVLRLLLEAVPEFVPAPELLKKW